MTLFFPPTSNGLQKTLGAALEEAATTVTLNNVTGIQNKAGVFVVDRIDTGGTEKSATVREYISFTGVSGSTLTGLTRGLGGGGADQDHAIGAVVEFVSDVVQQQGILSALANSHTSAGAVDTTKVVDLTTAQTLTNKTLTTPVIATLLQAAGKTLTMPATPDTLVAKATTDTLTNKRITKRVTTTTDDATAAIDTDSCDEYELSAVANNTTFTLTGTPTDGQTLIVRFKDAGVSKTLTWTGFTAVGVTLPTATTAGKWHYVGCKYNLGATAWHAIAVAEEE